MQKELYTVKYSCGCIHEIERDGFNHVPTGNNKDCKTHDKKEMI